MASNAARSSALANDAPKQKWFPSPKATCWLTLSLSMLNVSGSSNISLSRLADANRGITGAPSGICVPESSTGQAVVRQRPATGLSKRRLSSMKFFVKDGSARSFSICSGYFKSKSIDFEIAAVVVSNPPVTNWCIRSCNSSMVKGSSSWWA